MTWDILQDISFYSDCLKIRPSNYGLGFLIGHSKKKNHKMWKNNETD